MSAAPLPKHLPLKPRLPEGACVKLIGLGGVGSIVARYLAVYLASLDQDIRLVMVDGDAFEPSNATRMLFSGTGNKAEVVRDELAGRFADSLLSLVAVPSYVEAGNLARLIHDSDIVLLAVDNHATRKLVGEFCAAQLANVCLISGGNDGVEDDATGRPRRGTYGNCQVYLRRGGEDLSPTLTRYHPEIERPADHAPSEKSCTELVASVPQLLFANLMTAAAILNAFWLHACGALHYGELAFDIADGLMRPVLPLPTAN